MFATSKNSPLTMENLEGRTLLSASLPQTHLLASHEPVAAITFNADPNPSGAGLGVELGTNGNAGPLVSSHAYAVMSTYMDSAGNTYLLVRNPWGTDGPNANGYQWVNCDTLLSQLSVVTSAVV